jgi:hypothetical protein
MAYCTTKTWQTIRIFANNSNFKMLYCTVWFRIDSNKGLHIFLKLDCLYNHKLALACGLVSIPSRRTFDRRLKTISTDIKERISTIGYLFVAEGIVDLSITAIDSTLIKAKGSVWHNHPYGERRSTLSCWH